MTRSRVLVALGGLAISAIFLWLAIRDADAGRGAGGARRRATSSSSCSRSWCSCSAICFQATALADGSRTRRSRVSGGSTRWCSAGSPATTSCRSASASCSAPAGSVARRRCPAAARSEASRSIACATSSRSPLFLVIGLQAVPTPEWLQRIVIGALLARRSSPPRWSSRACTRARAIATAASAESGPPDRPRHDRLARRADRPPPRGGLARAQHRRLDARHGRRVPRRRSVGIDLEPLEAVFVASALALGVAIPSSPGYVGTYQWIGVASLGLLDVPVNQALAFSILMQASWFVPTTLVGGAILGWRRARRCAEDADLGGRYPPLT